MKNISDTVSESVNYLGQEFLLAYYLPALVFVLAHIYLLIPAWIIAIPLSQGQTTKLVVPLIGEINLTSIINILVWSLLIGVILFVLNSVLIKLFEGKPYWIKEIFLKLLTKRNEKFYDKHYKFLVDFKKRYLKIENDIRQANSLEEQSKLEIALAQTIVDIQDEYKRIEEELRPRMILPHNKERICPTSFGNAFAIAEEYSYERYGIDAVLFWPRLRQLMQEKASNHSLLLTQQKTVVDLSINFAFLFGLLAVEAALTSIFLAYQNILLIVSIIAIILTISFYRASVSAIQVLGELIKISFDYHRGLVLEAFNLKMPNNLSEEQVIWVKLATFIRRGDVFYFPEKYRKTETKNDEAEKKKNTNE
jgi:hypothetical protein